MSLIAIIISSGLTALSLPTAVAGILLPNLGFLAWIAIIPFYLALQRASIRQAIEYSFLFGAFFYLTTCYPAYISVHTYAQLNIFVSIAIYAWLISALALFMVIFFVPTVYLKQRGIPLWITLPLAWVVQDFLRSYFPVGGFPLGSLAYAQRGFLHVLQVVDLTGPYGVTFLLILSNGVLAELWRWYRKERAFPKTAITVMGVCVCASLVYGSLRLHEFRTTARKQDTINLAMVQGNLDQGGVWERDSIIKAIHKQVALSQQVPAQNLDLVIWPESPTPAAVKSKAARMRHVSRMTTPLLFGVLEYEGRLPPHWPPTDEDVQKGFVLYNSALLVAPGGTILDKYHKSHLIPFGEYVPTRWLLRYFKPLVPTGSNYTADPSLNVLEVARGPNNSPTKFGVLICFEDMFPEIARTFTRKGADFLVNITNDGWYGKSSVPYQHFEFSRFRAIENRRSLARSTNTGITAFFAPSGDVIAKAPSFQEASIHAAVPVGGPLTFYTRFGDIFAGLCAAGLLILLGLQIMRTVTRK